MSSVVTGIDVVSIPVRDQDVARAFYCDVLGFSTIADTVLGEEMRWVQVAPSGSDTSFSLVTWFESMLPGGVSGVVLSTPDINSTRRRLVDAGVDATAIEDAPWGRYFTFTDPDGNGLVMREPA